MRANALYFSVIKLDRMRVKINTTKLKYVQKHLYINNIIQMCMFRLPPIPY